MFKWLFGRKPPPPPKPNAELEYVEHLKKMQTLQAQHDEQVKPLYEILKTQNQTIQRMKRAREVKINENSILSRIRKQEFNHFDKEIERIHRRFDELPASCQPSFFKLLSHMEQLDDQLFQLKPDEMRAEIKDIFIPVLHCSWCEDTSGLNPEMQEFLERWQCAKRRRIEK